MSIAWDESLSVGDPAIDTDHQAMIEMIARLQEVADGLPDFSEIGRLLERLLACCRDHFVREEVIQESSGFPGAEDHRSNHALLLRHLESLVSHYVESCDAARAEIVRTLGDSLATWMVGHIGRHDSEFRAFLTRND